MILWDGATEAVVMRWNSDKKHRCPWCHAVTMQQPPSSLAVYQCCRCGTRFTRWPAVAWLLPDKGVVCPEHRRGA